MTPIAIISEPSSELCGTILEGYETLEGSVGGGLPKVSQHATRFWTQCVQNLVLREKRQIL